MKFFIAMNFVYNITSILFMLGGLGFFLQSYSMNIFF